MKRLLIAAFCGIVMVSVTACGPNKKQEVVESTPPVVAEPTPVAEEVVETVPDYIASTEIKESTPLNPMFQFGNTTITLGENLIGDLLDGEAEFIPSEKVDDLEKMLLPGQEVEVKMMFEESPFTVTAKNDTKEEASIRNSVVSSVFSGQGFFAVGGIRVGDPVDELTLAFDEPYAIEDGKDSYSDLIAYRYASQYDDTNVTFFTGDNMVISFYERMPVKYIQSTDDITEMSVFKLTEDRKEPRWLTENPYMLDVEGSDHATSKLSDITWKSASVYSLDEIRDPDTFNTTEENFVPVNYLVVEYEGRLDYNAEELNNLSILNSSLEPSYPVYGCFYLLNAYVDENGNIQSKVGDVREIDGVYADEKNMINALFDNENGYSIKNYTMTDIPLS